MKFAMAVDVKKLIEFGQLKFLKELLVEQEPATVLEMIKELPSEEILIVFRLLPKDTAAIVFTELETDEQLKLLSLFKEEKAKEIIENMDPDDRVELFDEMPANVVKKLLDYLSPEERKQTLTLLNFPEDSAGRIMTPYYLDVKANMTVEEALKHIKKVGNTKETIYTLFAIDDDRKLSGVLELKDLIFSDSNTLIKELMNEDPIYVTVFQDREEVYQIMRDYDLLALPVTDSEKRLVGIITIDDIVDVIEDEATEDIQKMAAVGVTESSYLHTSIWKLVKSRVFWLITLLVLESAVGFIIDGYSEILQKITILAAFIPTINAMGGNTGGQISAIMIRSMAIGDVESSDMKKIFYKEVVIGSILGSILTVIMALRAFVSTQNIMIILSLSASLLIVILISNLLGAFLPFFAKKIRIDPAVISGPLISTLMDLISMSVYFAVSTMLLKNYL